MAKIIMSSGSIGTTQEDLEKFIESREDLETDKTHAEPEDKTATQVPEEPKRDDFESDEDFALAHEEWKVAQEKPEKAEDDEPEEKPEKRSRKQRAIDRATRELREQNAELLKRLEALEGKAPKSEPQKEEKRPARADFKTDEEFQDALIDWGTKRALAKKEAQDAANAQRESDAAMLQNYSEQVEEAKEKYPDWEEVRESLGNAQISESAQLAIIRQENGADITYYLAKHPVYRDKLNTLHPLDAIVEVGRLSMKLRSGTVTAGTAEGAATKPKTPPKKLPEPVTPVSTAATASTLTSRDVAAKRGNFQEWKKLRAAGK